MHMFMQQLKCDHISENHPYGAFDIVMNHSVIRPIHIIYQYNLFSAMNSTQRWSHIIVIWKKCWNFQVHLLGVDCISTFVTVAHSHCFARYNSLSNAGCIILHHKAVMCDQSPLSSTELASFNFLESGTITRVVFQQMYYI